MYKNPVQPIYRQNQHKDAIISQLKNQLFDLRQLEADYMRLNDQVASLEDKYSLLLDQKQRSEKEQRQFDLSRVKSEIDKNSILELRQQIDTLRIQIQKITVQIQQTLRQNTALKRMSDARANQIQAIISQNRQIQGKNQRQNDQNRNLALNIKGLKQERNKLQDDCDRLSDLLDKNIARLKGLQRDARNAQANNARLDKTLLQAQNDNDKVFYFNQLNIDLRNKTQDCRRADAKLGQLDAQIDDLKNTLRNLQNLSDKHKSQAATNHASLQNQINKGKDLSNRLSNLDNAIRGAQNQLDDLHAEQNSLRKGHFDLMDQNKCLNAEIDNCLAIISEYQLVNRDLIEEIEAYIQSDQQAIAILSRRDIMRQLIARTCNKISSTYGPIAHLKH